MVVGIVSYDIVLQGTSNLKEKRSAVRKLVERIRNRFPVSVAEVGCQDLWQRTVIGVAVVGNDPVVIQGVIDRISDFIDSGGEYEVLDRVVDLVRY
ncbi:MAG: DUF503 domain-containing protein [Deltaproteobacteria bacterium]|nr:MAG: DUF503 domain-containing protein [Deltaproteobacteria bacterium]